VFKGLPVFIMPYFDSDGFCRKWIIESIMGILKQSDPNWELVIVNDASPNGVDAILDLTNRIKNKVTLITLEKNSGPGVCRNIGINWAYEHKASFLLFNDADDISHELRLELVRNAFEKESSASVVYVPFVPIDENGREVDLSCIESGIKEIWGALNSSPPIGKNAWIQIATETGYVNLTSGTAVRTELAYNYPFPRERVSEDFHTWLRYSAAGGQFIFVKDAPTRYRVLSKEYGSSSRLRAGGLQSFYKEKSRVDASGFSEALQIALSNRSISPKDVPNLIIRFRVKLAETFIKVHEFGLAQLEIQKAIQVSAEDCISIGKKRGGPVRKLICSIVNSKIRPKTF